ncbi:MAG TPA: site-specific DNA-methyltransferase [Candidatus Moranbacteria bacterium]|nr:site-specific DNA-methyltransferase [Candidatus Moranbacteria bacterium]
MDVAEDQKRKLKEIFPNVFNEDKVDFERLKLSLGEDVDAGGERYGMMWPGKAECMKIIQQPSIGTLKAAKKESVDFDITENLFIEGDNLEILKLLQNSYYGKVKIIYIDPPYNTGNEFIYPDKYSESLETYLAYTGQADEDGKKFSTNTESDGRFHSKWLNMMHPRLYLARNLLREDGVIFISIDDNEVSNLRKMCDEVFGEENLLSQLVWKKKYTGGKHTKGYVDLHEYILVYAKNSSLLPEIGIARPEDEKGKFEEEDEFVSIRGKFYVRPLKSNLELRPTLIYPIKAPDGSILKTQWLVAEDTFQKLLSEKRVEFRKKKDGTYQIYRKYYENDGEGLVKPPSLIEKYPNNEAKIELKELFDISEGRDNLFYTVKPLGLLKHLFEPFCDKENSIILDFFAGSCTTAHATLELNNSDCGSRKFICIQLPEPCDEESEAFKAGYKTIADIGKERIRRAIKKIKKERKESKKEETLFENGKKEKNEMDFGFKVFKLDRSNFKVWESKLEEKKGATNIEKQLELHIAHIDPKATADDILYELLLKSGFSLTTKVEEKAVSGKKVYSIENGALLVCLEKELTKEVITEMARLEPARVVCLDQGFSGNDQLKTNAVQIMKSHGVNDFRTV